MKRMRSKTILLDVKSVGANQYVLPNHNDYEYIDICAGKSEPLFIRVYKEQSGAIFFGDEVEVFKSANQFSILLKGTGTSFQVFAVGWK